MIYLWQHYEWPSLVGNGPEDLTSLVAIGLLSGLVVRPIVKWFRHQRVLVEHIIRHHPGIPVHDHTGKLLVEEHPKEPT